MLDPLSTLACALCAVLLLGGAYAFTRYYRGDREGWIWTALACFATALLLATAVQRADRGRPQPAPPQGARSDVLEAP